VKYEPRYERFTAAGPDGATFDVEFVKSGFLAMGDRPELFFFRAAGGEAAAGSTEIVVGISGDALRRFERGRRTARFGAFADSRRRAGAADGRVGLFIKHRKAK
jgi:hypothetical protein